MDVMNNKYAILCGVGGVVLGLAFGLLINSVVLAVATVAIAGMAIGGVFDVRRQLPPDEIM